MPLENCSKTNKQTMFPLFCISPYVPAMLVSMAFEHRSGGYSLQTGALYALKILFKHIISTLIRFRNEPVFCVFKNLRCGFTVFMNTAVCYTTNHSYTHHIPDRILKEPRLCSFEESSGFFTVQREASPPSPLHMRGEKGAGITLFFYNFLFV